MFPVYASALAISIYWSSIFLNIQNGQFDTPQVKLSAAARKALKTYPFPGNVRELENILERAVTLCEGNLVEESDLILPSVPNAETVEPPLREQKTDSGELQNYLDDVERERILEALEKTRWNKTQAAKLLGISFRALRYRLEKLDLDKT